MFALFRSRKTSPLNTPERYTDLSVELSRAVLKPIGAWPQSACASKTEKRIYMSINMLCYALIGFILIPCTIYVILEVRDPYQKLQLTAPMNFCLMAILKYCSLTLRDREIRQCVEYIENDWRQSISFSEQVIMIENAMFGRKLIKICAVFMYGGAAFYYIARPLSMGKVFAVDGNFTYRRLVYPVARSILDTRRSPVNEIFFSIQCLSGFLAHSITVGACSLAAVFAMHAYGQLELLMAWLKQLVDGRQDSCDSVDDRLAHIVKKHVQVLGFISLTKKVVNEVSLFEIVASTLSICFLGYYIIMEWESTRLTAQVTYFILLFSIGFNIFIFCYIGQLLSEQCKKVGQASYMIDWYRLPGKRSLSLMFIIAISNTNVKLTAGNLFELSLSSFGDVIKTSLAYLNMLRTLTS